MKLTIHQRRVVAALYALETKHELRWWSRNSIGAVVDAGGYHSSIQLRTVKVLKAAGLIQTEWSSWPEEFQALVHCNCACWKWGLTDTGREFAQSLNIRFGDETLNIIDCERYNKKLSEKRDGHSPETPLAHLRRDDGHCGEALPARSESDS